MMSLVNKSVDWTPNYHKILIFSPPKSLKRLRAARIDQLADSNEPAKIKIKISLNFFLKSTKIRMYFFLLLDGCYLHELTIFNNSNFLYPALHCKKSFSSLCVLILN